jgi:predicted DNA-binding protein (MmcQ/YjbR family)
MEGESVPGSGGAVARTLTNAEIAKGLRRICRNLPEATEKPFGGHAAPSFRVREKLFVITSENGEHLTCKAPPGDQQILVASDPARYFVPPYVGSKGWVGIRLDGDTDWGEVAELVEDSYRLIAPKRLSALLDAKDAKDAKDANGRPG